MDKSSNARSVDKYDYKVVRPMSHFSNCGNPIGKSSLIYS